MSEGRNDSRYKRYFLFSIIVILLAWAVYGFALYDAQDRGTFGDMYGALNALFSGFAFAALFYAILLQREDLKLQRKELELTRNEIEGQKLQLQAQNETIRLQSFENTFFQLLRLHNEIITAMDLDDLDDTGAGKSYSGRDCFTFFYEEFVKAYKFYERKEGEGRGDSEKINDYYQRFYAAYQSELGHYFRNLYNIIKFVKNGSSERKRFYTNIVRAQLSSFELALLFYNCLSDMGREKFKPMIEDFALLKNLPDELLLEKSHKSLYNESAR